MTIGLKFQFDLRKKKYFLTHPSIYSLLLKVKWYNFLFFFLWRYGVDGLNCYAHRMVEWASTNPV